MYKPEHIPESGSFARSLAKMAKYYHASLETWKLTTSFEDGKAVYTLHGRDSSLDTFEVKGFTPEQVIREANQELAARYAGKHKNELAVAEQIQVPEVVNKRTTEQAGEIIHLLNHPLITRQEKTKMLLNINRLDEERATQAIAKLRQAIADREGTTAIAA